MSTGPVEEKVVLPPFLSADDVRALPRDRVVLADARLYLDGRQAREEYERGHLPGAVYVDLERDASGSTEAVDGLHPGRHPLPDAGDFAAAMSRLGIGDESVVVAYDDAGGIMAARLVWMLRALGVAAAVLDGGPAAWPEPLVEGSPPIVAPATFTPRAWPLELLASIDDVAALRPDEVLLDARSRDRYAGEGPSGPDPQAGHVPGAVNLPVTEHTDDAGRLLPMEELAARVRAAGVDGGHLVSSCGSGVTACHNLLVVEHLGLGRGRLYPGSWSQWSRAGRPVVTGADPR